MAPKSLVNYGGSPAKVVVVLNLKMEGHMVLSTKPCHWITLSSIWSQQSKSCAPGLVEVISVPVLQGNLECRQKPLEETAYHSLVLKANTKGLLSLTA